MATARGPSTGTIRTIGSLVETPADRQNDDALDASGSNAADDSDAMDDAMDIIPASQESGELREKAKVLHDQAEQLKMRRFKIPDEVAARYGAYFSRIQTIWWNADQVPQGDIDTIKKENADRKARFDKKEFKRGTKLEAVQFQWANFSVHLPELCKLINEENKPQVNDNTPRMMAIIAYATLLVAHTRTYSYSALDLLGEARIEELATISRMAAESALATDDDKKLCEHFQDLLKAPQEISQEVADRIPDPTAIFPPRAAESSALARTTNPTAPTAGEGRGSTQPGPSSSDNNGLSSGPPSGPDASRAPTETQPQASRMDAAKIAEIANSITQPGLAPFKKTVAQAISERGRVAFARRLNRGVRLCLNIGTEQFPFHVMFSGGDFGKVYYHDAAARASVFREDFERLLRQHDKAGVKSTQDLRSWKDPQYSLEDVVSLHRSDGEDADVSAKPALWVLVKYAGDPSINGKRQWLSKSELVILSGTKSLPADIERVLAHRDANALFLKQCRSHGFHPDTLRPLNLDQLQREPWLAVEAKELEAPAGSVEARADLIAKPVRRKARQAHPVTSQLPLDALSLPHSMLPPQLGAALSQGYPVLPQPLTAPQQQTATTFPQAQLPAVPQGLPSLPTSQKQQLMTVPALQQQLLAAPQQAYAGYGPYGTMPQQLLAALPYGSQGMMQPQGLYAQR